MVRGHFDSEIIADVVLVDAAAEERDPDGFDPTVNIRGNSFLPSCVDDITKFFV